MEFLPKIIQSHIFKLITGIISVFFTFFGLTILTFFLAGDEMSKEHMSWYLLLSVGNTIVFFLILIGFKMLKFKKGE